MMKMQSFRFLKTFVRRSVRKLRGEGEDDDSVYDGQRDVVEALAKLSDEGVIEALPNLLRRVKLKTLVVINNILQGDETVVRNLEYLIGRIKYLIHDIHSGQPGQRGKPLTKRLQDIVTILRCRDSYKKVLRTKLQLEGSSPVEVAESALLQVDDFPACHLNAMLRTIKNRLPGEVGRAERFAEKARLTRNIQKAGYGLLATCGGRKLPEDLRKCLIVMSLSARHIYGNDGSLIDFLSPISIEKRSLHRIILAALSNLKYLTVENLRLLFQDLGPRYVRPYKRITPKIMRCAAKAIFLDCLLYSELRPVPECVRTAAENLKGRMRQQSSENTKPKNQTEKYLKKDLRRSTELELEAVLRVSSHLQQIIRDLSESPEESVSLAHESDFSMLICRRNEDNTSPLETRQPRERSPDGAFEPVPDARAVPSESQEVDCRLDDVRGAEKNKQIQIWSINKTHDCPNGEVTEKKTESRESCQREALSQAETRRLRNITRIGDEAAGVGYTLVGCALEEISMLTGLMLEAPVKSYLRSGLKRRLCRTVTEDEKDLREQDQVSLILSLAENDSRISSRTMDRVKRRLVQS